MRIYGLIDFSLAAVGLAAAVQSTAGVEGLVQRRLPDHVNDFSFTLTNSSTLATNNSTLQNDHYTVSNGANNTICIEGNSPIALASGLHWYLSSVVHVDIYWFVGSRLHLAPQTLPRLNSTYSGSSIVPWRYHFNTVTFSYTAAFWTWDDWELELDWLALRGVNLPLAWVGQEKILVEVFQDAGFTDAEISTYLSGPAFQAWNRFGNIQGCWGGELPMSWIDGQYALNKQIVSRMVELGMTPVMPCFTGFVPRAVDRVFPNSSFVNGSTWNDFPLQYTNDTFLEPSDARFAELQNSFISKQTAAYGKVSNIYTLDQFNENDPTSGDLTYLRNVTYYTWQSLKAADPDAIWMMQGWLFYSNSVFWTNERIEAFLSGVETNSDMLILDLFSESQPQWQRTNSYYGKPWIWCELHDYGGNMGLYGQVENVTINPIEALANSSSLVGFGLTMEGQEGNEIMYDILLDQAWSATPIDIELYFHDWVTSRYAGAASLPAGLYTAWDIMRQTIYNNTDITIAEAVTKSIFELSPNTTGLLNRTGHHATTIQYNPADLVTAWSDFYGASAAEPSLWDNPAYTFDLTDITRQVMANAFDPLYTTLLNSANSSLNDSYSLSTTASTGLQVVALLSDLDSILAADGNAHYSLSDWIASARAWADPSGTPNITTNVTAVADTAAYYEYNARNQITLWGPSGQISDYASKQWAGLISSYYVPRWQMFIDSLLNGTTAVNGANAGFASSLLAFEEEWQIQTWGEAAGESYALTTAGELQSTIATVVKAWPGVFGST